ncbi:hypothetical protein ORJ04_03220 [Rheinheimera baltica]|uniref:Capsular polysaccharide export system protein KpsC n=1 Tax=Rheinheimera baltica TaxID=67576 RepID=A0ABT9HWA3_9GAMM|nr:hypothetical protein [Rheinheimera baltica]
MKTKLEKSVSFNTTALLSCLLPPEQTFCHASCSNYFPIRHAIKTQHFLSDVARSNANQFIRCWQDTSYRINKTSNVTVPVLASNTVLIALAGLSYSDSFLRQVLDYLCAQYVAQPICVWCEHAVVVKHSTLFEQYPTLQLVQKSVPLSQLLTQIAVVICDTALLQLEAILWHKRVVSFNATVFTELGLTTDIYPHSITNTEVTLQQLVDVLFFSNFYQPQLEYAQQHRSVMSLLKWVCLQYQQRARFTQVIYAWRFSTIWRPVLKQFLQGCNVIFVKHENSVPEGSTLVVWGKQMLPQTLLQQCKIIRVEDGFLRSVGLGAEFARPVSWVFDSRGIYFDATTESELEYLLKTTEFTPELVSRGDALINAINQAGLTKYNVGTGSWIRPSENKRVILVAGQVESDASIEYGSLVVKSNLELLKLVRMQNADAYVVYKPHPDVVAKARQSGEGEHRAAEFCNEIVTSVNMAALLPLIDELHTMTSLSGFEALLRGKKVVCYGQPFYSGWGLTTDIYPLERRSRVLTLAELAVATLILYPVYISRDTQFYAEPEQILSDLLSWQNKHPHDPWLAVKKLIRTLATVLLGKSRR